MSVNMLNKLFLVSVGLVVLVSCGSKSSSTNQDVILRDFEALHEECLELNIPKIRFKIDSLIRNDSDGLTADFRTRSYYRNHNGFIWIGRKGIDSRADTVFKYLQRVGEMGFSKRRFGADQIGLDLLRWKNLDFDGKNNDVNSILARLEYLLTKGYLRYVVGQRFGYMNPTYVFNRLDTVQPHVADTVNVSVRYKSLFDIKMEHADKSFFQRAIRMASKDSLSCFLREVQPDNAYYLDLKRLFNEKREVLSSADCAKMMCNMERFLWRQADAPEAHEKYVMVNIPSFQLLGVDGKDTIRMRIGCGSLETKTPLLTSLLKRMDINPKWYVPRSIVDKDIVPHISKAYFDRRNFYVADRRTGKEVDIHLVTRSLLQDPGFAVVQRGGKGNSLGRIIFRFDNNFSVYLHDTPSRDFFNRENRGVSHGCVRVEHPLDLAKFLLGKKDKQLEDKIEYSMTADSLENKSMVVGSVQVKPQVPVYLAYYTMYPGGKRKDGTSKPEVNWISYPDVYGYDQVIYRFLQKNYR